MASANIETVFSGAGRISGKSRTLSPSLLSDYAFCHYNYKYDWLRPSLNEIIAAYEKLYGKKGRDSDEESDASSDDEVALTLTLTLAFTLTLILHPHPPPSCSPRFLGDFNVNP